MWVLSHEILHFLIGTVVAAFAFWKFKSWRLVVLAYLVTIFLDIDHLFDYFMYVGFSINPGQFLGANYFCPSGRLVIPLHGWEWPLILIFLARFSFFRPWAWVVILAMAGHLALDQLSNFMNPLGYSFLFRLSRGFDINQVSYGCLL